MQTWSLDDLLEILPEAVFSFCVKDGKDTTFPYVSDKFSNITALSSQDVKKDATPFLNNIDEKKREEFFKNLEVSSNEMNLWQMEFRYKHPTKGTIWLSWYAKPFKHDELICWRGVLHDITEHKVIKKTLLQKEREFRSLSENIPDNIARWDTQARYTYLNPTHVRTLGISSYEDAIGKTLLEISGKADGEEGIRQVIATAQPVYLQRLPVYYDDDRIEYHDVKLAPEFDEDGNVVSVLGVGRDMTDLYHLHDEIAEREREFRALAESSPDLVIRTDKELRIRYINSKLLKFLGDKKLDEIIGYSSIELWPDGRFETVDQLRREAMHSGTAKTREIILPTPEGKLSYHQIISVPERNVNGDVVGSISFGRDVTDVHEGERLLRYTIDNIPGMAFTFHMSVDGHGSFPYVSQDIEEYFGLSAEDVKNDMSAIHNMTHIDDRPRIEKILAESVKTAAPLMFETRICRANYPDRWLSVHSSSEYQPDGSILWYGIMLDITERKKSELKLQMAASVFKTANEGISITDPEGFIIDVNPAFSRISGYNEDEVIGRRSNILSSGHHDKAFYNKMWSDLKKDGSWSGEIINRNKNGNLYTEYLSIVTVKDKFDVTQHYIGIFSDISKMKEHEKQLYNIAHHDFLTGLPNRILLLDRLTQALADSQRSKEKVAVFFLDLDGFKPINDTYGHKAGDKVLVKTATRVKDTLRNNDTFARVGGDEFVAVFRGVSGKEECEMLARRLLNVIDRPIVFDEYTLSVSASMGISIYPDDSPNEIDTLLNHADKAMYIAKQTKDKEFIFYDPSFKKES